MARPSELIPGNSYFMVNYYEGPALVIPAVYTYLFVGREKDDDGHDVWIFREPPSPQDPEANTGPDDEILMQFDENSLYQILDLRGLIRELGGLVDFHPLVKSSAATTVARREAFAEVAPEVERLVSSEQWSAVTITVKYTDDGFSISKSGDQQLRWSFFPKTKIESEREEKIRSIFRERGAAPTRDYLSDKGKTRILNYVLPRDQALTVSLCGRLLGEVYDMRAEDELRFQFSPKRDEPT